MKFESTLSLVWISIVSLILGAVIGKLLYQYYLTKKEKNLEEKVKEAETQAKGIIEKAEKNAHYLIQNAQKDSDKKMEKIDYLEKILIKKEEKLDVKIDNLEIEKEKIIKKQEEVNSIIDQQKHTLSNIAQMSPEEAKNKLFEVVETEYQEELVKFINKFKTIKQEESDKEAAQIIASVLPKVNIDIVSEFTVSNIDIPSEDTKWKIIWREWRNISYFERLTWVELIIDDTPLTVKISSFDPEKRFIASETLKILIKDWRINPVYIKKILDDVQKSLPDIYKKKWEEALSSLNLPLMNPEIVRLIWQFHIRYSYGQNLLIHSIEVARIAENIANELWLDWVLAKKAWLLHDIWKLSSWNWQAHSKVWADLLRKYWIDKVIINAAEGHHYDVPLTHPIGWIVAAADAISAWRPWARFNTKELFIERMTNLEKLVGSIQWIEKVYIMQAWREIMVFANPEQIDDLGLEKLVKEIWNKIEWQLDYPGVIRIAAVRETKVVDYLK